jgi:hypothetical protein
MMHDIISDIHKEGLRTLVKLVREKSIPEEFTVDYTSQGTSIFAHTSQAVHVNVSSLGLEALTRAGYLFSIPHYERQSFDWSGQVRVKEHESYRRCYITPAGFRAVDNNFAPVDDIIQYRTPLKITTCLDKFRQDFPDPSRLAFVMMKFGKTKLHNAILGAIQDALQEQGFTALRADDKEYADDVLDNILTYIYGCRFGIAVFERIEGDDFNPNVALEIGYMMGINKQVCLLKDQTLKGLNTDLTGKLYKEFDPQNCDTTILPLLRKWMQDKGITTSQIEQNGSSE